MVAELEEYPGYSKHAPEGDNSVIRNWHAAMTGLPCNSRPVQGLTFWGAFTQNQLQAQFFMWKKR